MKVQNSLYFTHNRVMAPRWQQVSRRPKCEWSWSCGEISVHALTCILCILWWRQFYQTVTSYNSVLTVKILRRRARGNGRHCLIKWETLLDQMGDTAWLKTLMNFRGYGRCCLLRLQGVGNPDKENRHFTLRTLFKRHWYFLLTVTKNVR